MISSFSLWPLQDSIDSDGSDEYNHYEWRQEIISTVIRLFISLQTLNHEIRFHYELWDYVTGWVTLNRGPYRTTCNSQESVTTCLSLFTREQKDVILFTTTFRIKSLVSWPILQQNVNVATVRWHLWQQEPREQKQRLGVEERAAEADTLDVCQLVWCHRGRQAVQGSHLCNHTQTSALLKWVCKDTPDQMFAKM